MKNYYETLGLQEGASQEEIQNAYERLCKELDPKYNNNQDFFKEEYDKVQKAYQALLNSSILATGKGAETLILKEKGNKEKKTETPINKKLNSMKIFKEITGAILSTVMIKVLFQVYFFDRRKSFSFDDVIAIKTPTYRGFWGEGFEWLFVISILLYLLLRFLFQIKLDKILTRTFYIFLLCMMLITLLSEITTKSPVSSIRYSR